MAALSLVDLASPLLPFVRMTVGLARTARPHLRRLHAEAQASGNAAQVTADLLEGFFKETFTRLLGSFTDSWWRDLLNQIGHAYVAPDFLRAVALRDWLSRADVQADLKHRAIATLLGDSVNSDGETRLQLSYSEATGEDQRLAGGPIAVVEAVLVAGFLAVLAPSDRAVAALLQAGIRTLGAEIQSLGDRLSEGMLAGPAIATHLARTTRDILKAILRRRVLAPDRCRQEIADLERRFGPNGDLRFAGHEVHIEILTWAARLNAGELDTVSQAIDYQARISEISPDVDTRIIDARILATRGERDQALTILREIDSADARANIFSVLYRDRAPDTALAWLLDERPDDDDLSFLTGVGWYNVAAAFARLHRWAEAIATVASSRALTEECPALPFLEGLLNTAMLFPAPVRPDALDTAPYFITAPTLEGVESDRHRAAALAAFSRAADVLDAVDLKGHAEEARAISLWLRLTDPVSDSAARARVEVAGAMRDGARAVRLLPVVRDLQVDFDPVPIRRYLDTRARLGGLSPSETLAEFVLTMLTRSPRARSEYLEANETRLLVPLNRAYLLGQRVKALLEDNQIARAAALLSQRRIEMSDEQHERFRTAVDLHGGVDVRTRAERLYEQTGSLLDLHNLSTILRNDGDWAGLRPLQEKRFALERTIDNLQGLIDCLRRLPTPDEDSVVRLLDSNADLVARRPRLISAQAWALLHTGQLKRADELNRGLLQSRIENSDLMLDINIAIQSGDWERFPIIIEREWARRDTIDATSLIRLATLAAEADPTSDRAMGLARLATLKAPADPQVLVAATSLAFQLGRDHEVDPNWMSQALVLSSEDGPVRRVHLRTIAEELVPAHRARIEFVEKATVQADIPLHFVATTLRLPLSHILLSVPRLNAAEQDARRRTVVPIISGARIPLRIEPAWRIGLDMSTILVLAHLGLLKATFAGFHEVVLAPDTMISLLNERRRMRFHQPSRVARAAELRSLLERGRLQALSSLIEPPAWLVAEVGRELADLLETARARDAYVVHPLPIRKVGSLGDAHADLREYSPLVMSTISFITAAFKAGVINRSGFDRIRAYLEPHDEGTVNEATIQPDLIARDIYIDDLALTYLHDSGSLEEIANSTVNIRVHPAVRSTQEEIIEANRHGEALAKALDGIRRELQDALASGKAVFLPHSLKATPALEDVVTLAAFLEDSARCDAVCIDDRFINRNYALTDQSGNRAHVLCSLDVLRFLEEQSIITAEQRREKLHRLRQGSFAIIPIEPQELEKPLREAQIDATEAVVEGPELRTIRQTLARLRSLDMIQQPAETAFLDRLRLMSAFVVRRLWHDSSLSVDRARVLGDWVWRFVAPSPLDWLRTSRHKSGLRPIDEMVGVHLSVLFQVAIGLSRDRRDAFDAWMDESVLRPLAVASPEFLDATAEMLKPQIEQWADDFFTRD